MKTLVCFFGEIRATHTTFKSIKMNLIDPLEADVMMCISTQDPDKLATDPLVKIAKHVTVVDDKNINYGDEFDKISMSCGQDKNWRKSLCIGGGWMQGLNDDKGYGGNVHAMYKKYILGHMIKKVIDEYDWFIITRPDLMWLGPHPHVRHMNPRAVFIPSGEDWGGYNDRHMVCSKETILKCVCTLNTVIFNSNMLVWLLIPKYPTLNSEIFLRIHLQSNQIPVGRFPNLAFLTMDKSSPRGWSDPHYHDFYQVYYKFRTELDSAVQNSGNTPFQFKGRV